MGWSLTEQVRQSALPRHLKLMAFAIAHVLRDKPKDDQPALTLYAHIGQLAHDCTMHPTAARKLVHELTRIGVLELVTPGGGWRRGKKGMFGVASLYRFHPEMLPAWPAGNPSAVTRVPRRNPSTATRVPSRNPSAVTRALLQVPEGTTSERPVLSLVQGDAEEQRRVEGGAPVGVHSQEVEQEKKAEKEEDMAGKDTEALVVHSQEAEYDVFSGGNYDYEAEKARKPSDNYTDFFDDDHPIPGLPKIKADRHDLFNFQRRRRH